MRGQLLRTVIIASSVAVLLAAACGGGGGPDSTATPAAPPRAASTAPAAPSATVAAASPTAVAASPTPPPAPTAPRAQGSAPPPAATPTPSPPQPTQRPPPSPAAQSITIVARDVKFSPAIVIITAGSRVDITLDNQDVGVQHNIAVFDPQGNRVAETEVVAGPAVRQASFAVTAPGRYPFKCTLHPVQMTGAITAQ